MCFLCGLFNFYHALVGLRCVCLFAKLFLCLFYKTKLYLCSSFSHVCVTDKLDWASVLVTSWIESCHWRAIWENDNQITKSLYHFNVHGCQSLTISIIKRQQGSNDLRQRMKKVYFPLYDKAWPSRSTTSSQSHLAGGQWKPPLPTWLGLSSADTHFFH